MNSKNNIPPEAHDQDLNPMPSYHSSLGNHTILNCGLQFSFNI